MSLRTIGVQASSDAPEGKEGLETSNDPMETEVKTGESIGEEAVGNATDVQADAIKEARQDTTGMTFSNLHDPHTPDNWAHSRVW